MRAYSKKIRMFLFTLCSLMSIVALSENDNILPVWREQFAYIDADLDAAIQNYQNNKKESALENVKIAQYKRYKNSDLETAVRLNRGIKKAEDINRQFTTIIQLISASENNLVSIKESVSRIKSDIKNTLPELPLTYKLQKKLKAQLNTEETERINNKDYNVDQLSLKVSLKKSLELYKNGQVSKALDEIKNTFYLHWQTSNLEATLQSDYKLKIENSFDQLYKAIQQGKDLEEISKLRNILDSEIDNIQLYKINKIEEKTGNTFPEIIWGGLGIFLIITFVLLLRRFKKRIR